MTLSGQEACGERRPATHETCGETRRWLTPLVLFGLTFAAFLPALNAEFVNWDDNYVIVENPHLQRLGAAELAWMFTAPHYGHYQPLTWLSLAIDCRLWGLDRPGGFHLTNLTLHAMTAVAFYFLARRLIAWGSSLGHGRSDAALCFAAAFAALCFAVHPLRVESVAWVTERRDVLSGLFFVLSILAYVKSVLDWRDGHPRTGWYVASILLCALSLLCKAHAVMLVGVLVLLDVFPLRRFPAGGLRPIAGKVPFLIMSLVFGALAVHAQNQAGAFYPVAEYDVTGRIAQGLYGHAFYLAKMVLPVSLGPLYELPSRSVLVGRLLWIGLSVFVASLAAALLLRRRFPFFPLAWGWYLIMLLPVSGVFQSGVQLAADRYTYLSCMGWALAGGALVGGLGHTRPGSSRRLVRAAVPAGLVIAALAALTWRQSTFWQDSTSLWRRGTAVSPDSAIAHANLGDALMHDTPPDYPAALQSYERALDLDPRDAKAHNGAAGAAMALNRPDAAVTHLERAVQLDPQYALARLNLAWMLATYPESRLRDGVRALAHAETACRLTDHNDPRALDALAAALAELHRFDEAVAAAQRARSLARSQGREPLAAHIEHRILLYQAGRPYRMGM